MRTVRRWSFAKAVAFFLRARDLCYCADMITHVAWVWLAAHLMGPASHASTLPADDLPLIGVCAQRLGKLNAEITLVAALDSCGVVALDDVAVPLPALLRRAARKPWFGMTPSGSSTTVAGATLLKQARLDADGDAQHLRLGPCNVPGTVYATRRMAVPTLAKPSPSALQQAIASQGPGGMHCLEQAWDHGGGRIEVLGRDAAAAPQPNAAACRSKPAKWMMLDPRGPPTKQGSQGGVAIYAKATGSPAAPVQVNHVKIDGRLLTWVLEQDDVSVSCAIMDDSLAPSLEMLRIEIEDLGC